MMTFDGRRTLLEVIAKAGFKSLSEIIAENTLFTHPKTVIQTKNKNLFRTIRNFQKRGQIVEWGDGNKVMCCDNEGPNRAFKWANGDFKYCDVQFNHIYTASTNVDVYTSIANICVTPAFLAKLTDTDQTIKELLIYRSYDLYGFYLENIPKKPIGYDNLKWKDFITPIESLEKYLLSRLIKCQSSRTSISARDIGWIFSDYKPDERIGNRK